MSTRLHLKKPRRCQDLNQSELPYPPLLFPGKREGVGTTLTNAPFQSLANIVA